MRSNCSGMTVCALWGLKWTEVPLALCYDHIGLTICTAFIAVGGVWIWYGPWSKKCFFSQHQTVHCHHSCLMSRAKHFPTLWILLSEISRLYTVNLWQQSSKCMEMFSSANVAFIRQLQALCLNILSAIASRLIPHPSRHQTWDKTRNVMREDTYGNEGRNVSNTKLTAIIREHCNLGNAHTYPEEHD